MRRLAILGFMGLLMLCGAIAARVTAGLTDFRYNDATQHVYARTDAQLSWTAAEAEAVAAAPGGGHLVTINDSAENDWVRANLGSGWIGYNDVDTEGTWVWSSGETPGYTNWAGGEPNDAGADGEDYANMRGGGGWNDLGASRTVYGNVEFPYSVATADLTQMRYNPGTNKRYALTTSTSWEAAELVARVHGGHLVTVNNAAENTWLADNMAPGNRWIGYTDAAEYTTDGNWVWSSGETSGYENWNTGEPNGGTSENSGAMSSTGLWNDANGQSHSFQGIAELDARDPLWRFNPVSGKLNAQTDRLRWNDAEAQAQHWGGHLATVGSEGENAHLHSMFGNGWIGFTDDTEYSPAGQTWVWSSGEGGSWTGDQNGGTGDSYTNWNGGEPNNPANEHYTEIRADNGKWNNLRADHERYGIAEKDATPPRWIYDSDGDRWYAETDALYWHDARAQARYWGADLVTIDNETENSFLDARFGGVWIGFNDEAEEGTWVWSDGSPVSYTNWNSGEPNNAGGSEHYAQMYGDGEWNDLPAERVSRGIAEAGIDVVRDTLDIIDGPTPVNRYAILGMMTWNEAQAAAEQLGGNLVTIRNQAENDAVRMLAESLGDNVWLGFTDSEDFSQEGDFVWASGEPTLYTNWNSGEPSNSGNEDFAAMYFSSGLWNDANATIRYYAIVEFVPEPSSASLALLGLFGLLGLERRRRR